MSLHVYAHVGVLFLCKAGVPSECRDSEAAATQVTRGPSLWPSMPTVEMHGEERAGERAEAARRGKSAVRLFCFEAKGTPFAWI